ncbi:hypothetical protein [Alkalicoccobacillus gibsonii]|jgi:hypothetical protein|uniref:hypothetical protein n=1 Tax=Alkalicoccobacillus gibsonii TaxID=79881 RepID=UPI00193161F3|nr:hypothetical protein [Alkalicoccobacillus gibsonii]MBM0065617.1 hypothetical protein [Alkalicoccobacillus gibsonii]
MGDGGMAEYGYFLSEKQLIDQHLEEGYDIVDVNDDLNGTTVQFGQRESGERTLIHIGNANSRKYLATMLSVQLANRRKVT